MKTTKTYDKQVASTILDQLGGFKFISMTGAKHLGWTDNMLSFKIGRNTSQANHVKITLDTNKDLYIIQFVQIKKLETKFVAEFSDVYADQLQEIFTKTTGLSTHL